MCLCVRVSVSVCVCDLFIALCLKLWQVHSGVAVMSSSSKRLFSQAVRQMGGEAKLPKAKQGSASGAYEGSRKENVRYQYKDNANCGFIELNQMSVCGNRQSSSNTWKRCQE